MKKLGLYGSEFPPLIHVGRKNDEKDPDVTCARFCEPTLDSHKIVMTLFLRDT